jgi:hypothetical protein
MTDDQIKQIIKSKLPGYRVVQRQQQAPHLDAEAVTEAGALRAKFGADDSVTPMKKESNDEIVTVEPEQLSPSQDRGGAQKVVVISKKDKKIIGMQG